MPKRWCQDCGRLYDAAATRTLRCPACQPAATARRNARLSSSARGLGWAFSRRKAKDVNYQEAARCQCDARVTRCTLHSGVCGQPFTTANPKTAGHAVARSLGGGDGPILPVCRSCNGSDGGRLAHRR